MNKLSFTAVIVAAGIGKRVGAEIPKQYLPLLDKTIIEHSLTPFLSHPKISNVVVSLASNDNWFSQLSLSSHRKLQTVVGGKERVDSVLAALCNIDPKSYVLVHDAARPCITNEDIDKLILHAESNNSGAILGSRVRDTMKRTFSDDQIKQTVDREDLWHALTPQLFQTSILIDAIRNNKTPEKITDEASAMEMAGIPVVIIEGRSDNLKVTRQEDLILAELFLKQHRKAII
ncbi:MAG: 2-C-methyl-D-erythritol 4-phosphate cytidylyltransferase [Psychromonas sp.]|nr:2-C-methyl-D-erythritol 4-phosphate cytidylyltransferase [Psychromonas sp.]